MPAHVDYGSHRFTQTGHFLQTSVMCHAIYRIMLAGFYFFFYSSHVKLFPSVVVWPSVFSSWRVSIRVSLLLLTCAALVEQ